ncbi:hypothetical protein [Saccharopolyspora phatthalungensis]|uniref:Uncharacterized protein n=1 Tax=Saccharopolyspora phatthalungensis TaxID=664693 RepID=A0A840QJW1_9PSEU|nr:hypothetical protein [Saccharopolyspora phatthalungensis]MBB5159385.1 hypothetical protein [Saccharopolyspora phatthalungensis]
MGERLVSACGSGSASQGPTAQQVVEQFQRDGLSVPNPRDDTAQNCASLGCVQLVATDTVSVVSFADESAASTFARKLGDNAHQAGAIVLRYDAAETPEDVRLKFQSSLARMAH